MGFSLQKILGFLFLIHAGFSTMQYRKYLAFSNSQETFAIPLDILLEIILGLSLNIFFGVLMSKPFENIREFRTQKSHDSCLSRPNFKNVYLNRGQILKPFLMRKVKNFDI